MSEAPETAQQPPAAAEGEKTTEEKEKEEQQQTQEELSPEEKKKMEEEQKEKEAKDRENHKELYLSNENGLFNDNYTLDKELGAGAFSTVRLGFHTKTEESYAIKVVIRKEMHEFDKKALKDEIQVLNGLSHNHIIKLYDVFYEPDYIYLIMEKVMGGHLFDRLVEKENYSENEARKVFEILLNTLEYCHENNVAHRDLKPENLLLISEDDDSSIKIADFGFSKKCTGPKSLKTQCGSPGHVAPEILENVAYDTQVDMWSLGVIAYTLLGGYPPFHEAKRRDQFRKIRSGDYVFDEEWWGHIGDAAKEMIRGLLTVDPSERMTATQALECQWMTGLEERSRPSDLGVNLKRLQQFNARRKLQGAVYAIMATHKLTSLGLNFHLDLIDENVEENEKKKTEENDSSSAAETSQEKS